LIPPCRAALTPVQFSESGKLVGKLFAKVGELLDDPDALVCLLIDEVESLSAARRASSSEPGDAVRVVNALLTQLDALKARPNVLVLTTTNMTAALDAAFIDRADLKVFVGPPSMQARYAILLSALRELACKGLLQPSDAMPGDWATLDAPQVAAWAGGEQGGAQARLPPRCTPTDALLAAAALSAGLSGRALRKLPFLAGSAVRPGGAYRGWLTPLAAAGGQRRAAAAELAGFHGRAAEVDAGGAGGAGGAVVGREEGIPGTQAI